MLPPQLDFGFESRRVGVVGLQRRAQSIVRCSVEIASALARAINSVAERLRGLVRKLSSAKRLETRLSVVEGILRGLAGAIQLLFQSIE